MKVIAKTGFGYLVEMTEDEIAKAAGYPYADGDFKKASGRESYSRDTLQIGTEIKVAAAYGFHSRIAEHQDAARKSAGTLRALADLLDGSMPDVVIPPAQPEPQAAPGSTTILTASGQDA
ncbi:hypothetical protein [Kaistia sp. MMO-174]|uniref:hypothetical protein n=1 Tax=Kaistia sp. MMO-174 TaxID=3081256 RepID=UPI00301657B0